MDRRDFLRLAGGAAIAAAGSACGDNSRRPPSVTAPTNRPKLRIVEFSHFVEGYDSWFDGFATRWGEEHDTDVLVDHISVDDVRLRAAAEISAGRGHDLLALFGTPVGALDDDVIDHRDIVAEIEGKVGPMLPVLARGVHNPMTGKYLGVSDFWAPIPVNYRTDMWDSRDERRPDQWEAILRAAPALKAAGAPVGIGLSPDLDSQYNAFALLFAFGGSLQNEAGVVTLDSAATLEAVKFATSLYRSGMPEDVLTWDNLADNRFLASGKGSLILDPLSALRATEKQDPDVAAKIGLGPPPAGPAGRPGIVSVVHTYVIWKFAENQSAAARFLVDLVLGYREAFLRSEFYNMPAFPGAVPDIPDLLAADPVARPAGKYRVLADAGTWTTNHGRPGSDNAAVAEVATEFIVGNMFAAAASGALSADDAVKRAAAQAQAIFAKWRERGKI
jgi:multiple sugar transport system substrate-binding protein